jgi:hypothetical protein
MHRTLTPSLSWWPALLATLAFALLAPVPGYSAGQVAETIERSFSVADHPTVVVRNVDGRTQIAAGSERKVLVRAVKEVNRAGSKEEAQRAAAEVQVRIDQVGNRIEVEAIYPRQWFSFGLKPQVLVRFEVTMPSAADLEARTVDGPLDVEGIDGRVQIASTDGPVAVRSCAGRIEARTTDGDLLLDGVRGEVRAHSTDGKVIIAGLLNILEVSTTDGGIEIDAEDGSRMNAEWSIRSTDGDVHLRLPEDFAADLDIATGDGHITNDYPVTMQGQVSSHRLMGKMFHGGELLRIRTSDGDIQIRKTRFHQ